MGLKYTARKSVPGKITSISPWLTVMMSLSSTTAPWQCEEQGVCSGIQPADGWGVPGLG